MAMSQPARRADPADHRHPAGETCPYCEQPIPNDRAAEIQEKFARAKLREEAATTKRIENQVAEVRAALDVEKQAAIAEVKAQAATANAAAREEGKKAAEAEANQRVADVIAARDAVRLQFEDSERQRQSVAAQLEALRTEKENLVAAGVAEARNALEKDHAVKINAKDAAHAEAMQKVVDELNGMRSRLADFDGEGADVNLYDVLKQQFPDDDIKTVNKKTGANIIHVVKKNAKECGKIVYDAGNRKTWSSALAEALNKDMVTEKASHAIITTSKFHDGGKQIQVCGGVIAANPARVAVLVEILRDEIIRNHSQKLSKEDQKKKTEKLYAYMTSGEFDNLLDSLDSNDDKLLALDEKEKKDHNAVWKRRRALTTEGQRLHVKVRREVGQIIGTGTTETE
jgi:hypothetical protein